MQLTIFTDYGLRTVMYLAAQPNKSSNVREIAEYFDISRHHLVKVVHRLGQLGHIVSTKGKGGGVQLTPGLEAIRIGDLVKTLELNMHLVECFDHKTNSCKITGECQLKHYLFTARKAFIDSLNQYTLADTVKNAHLFPPFQK